MVGNAEFFFVYPDVEKIFEIFLTEKKNVTLIYLIVNWDDLVQ